VEKFKIEGAAYRKFAGLNNHHQDVDNADQHQKIPLTAYGRPGTFSIFTNIIKRQWSRISPTSVPGLKTFALKNLLMPAFFFILWIFYYEGFKNGADEKKQYQRTFVTRSGLVFNSLAGAYFISIVITVCTFAADRTRYYQETREGIYTGPIFLLATLIANLPISLFTTAMSAFIIFRGLKNELLCTVNNDQQLGSSQNFASCKSFADYTANEIQSMERLGVPTWLEYSYYPDLFFYWLTFWACYLLAEQQTISLLMVIKSSYTAALASVYATVVYLVLGSATVRSLASLPEFMEHLTFVTQSRYTGAILNNLEFYNKTSLTSLQWINATSSVVNQCQGSSFEFGCRYIDGNHYLKEKYDHKSDEELDATLNVWFNFGVAYIFPLGMLVVNMVLYLIPLPAFVKAKFRE